MAHVLPVTGHTVAESRGRDNPVEDAREQMIRSTVTQVASASSFPIAVTLISGLAAPLICLVAGPVLTTDLARFVVAVVAAFLCSIGVMIAVVRWYTIPRVVALVTQLDRNRAHNKRIAVTYDRLCTEDPTFASALDGWRAYAERLEERAIQRARHRDDAQRQLSVR